MTKEEALSKIKMVKDKRPDDYIPELMDEIILYVEGMVDFSKGMLHKFIDSKMPTKMGGVYIYQNKALRFLKNELKKVNKK